MSRLFEVRSVMPHSQYKKEILKSARTRAYILNEMKGIAKLVQRDLYKTVQFWKHTVIFDYRIHYAGGNLYISIGPIGSVRGARIWGYIDQGTAAIPVLFHEKYQPKTNVATTYSGAIGTNWPGNQYNLPRYKIIGKKLLATPPGIRPRNWSEILQTYYEPYLYDAVDFAIKRGLDLI